MTNENFMLFPDTVLWSAALYLNILALNKLLLVAFKLSIFRSGKLSDGVLLKEAQKYYTVK